MISTGFANLNTSATKKIYIQTSEEKNKKPQNIRISSSFNFKENCLIPTEIITPDNTDNTDNTDNIDPINNKHNDIDAGDYSCAHQLKMLGQIHNNSSCDFAEKQKLIKDIKTKISSYMQQDKLKSIYDETEFISFAQVIEKLFVCSLKCHYCNKNMQVIYKYKRCPRQWTLDRVSNNIGHNHDNVVMSCLSCNLTRRCLNSEKFLFTRKLNIIKTLPNSNPL